MCFDESYELAVQHTVLDISDRLAAAPPSVAPTLVDELIRAVLPTRLRLDSLTMSLRCELGARRDVGVAVTARPLNLGYEARFGSTETWATQFKLEVTQSPPPHTGASRLSAPDNP